MSGKITKKYIVRCLYIWFVFFTYLFLTAGLIALSFIYLPVWVGILAVLAVVSLYLAAIAAGLLIEDTKKDE